MKLAALLKLLISAPIAVKATLAVATITTLSAAAFPSFYVTPINAGIELLTGSSSNNSTIQQFNNTASQVLAESTSTPSGLKGKLEINIPTFFNDTVSFNAQSLFAEGLRVEGPAIFNEDLTAPNVIYSLLAGTGIGISSGQTPTITNTGVTSLQGSTGALTLVAGSGMTISGLTITNNDKGSSQNIFKTIGDGSTTFSAGSNTDTLTFAASSGLSLSVDTTNKKLTFSGTSSTTAWTLDSTSLYPSSTTYSVGIGTTSPGKTLDVAGTGAFSSLLTLTGVPSSSGVNTGSLYINPATSTADYTLFGVAVGGVEKLRIDAEGDIHIQGSIISTTPGTVGYWSRTSTNTYLGNSGDLVGIGTSAPAAGIEVVRNGAASQPGGLFSGTWYTGGSSTTTKPQLLVEPTGTTSTGWSTSGTGIGVNAASTFAGNLLDLEQAGNSTFKVAGVSSGVNGFTFTTGAASSGVNMSATGSDTNIALTLDSKGTGAVNLGTGASAKTITIGNNTGATALALTSGTGSQTFTSSVATGTTTTSAWVFNDAALTTGTGAYFTSSTLTTGKLVDINTGSANTLTSGTMLNLASVSTGLTTGSLISLDWSPGSVQSTAATGNLFNINIGANATNFAGNLFNVGDAGSSIFSISKSAVTSALPLNITAPGDSTFAYDIQMTNPTSSFIKSTASLVLQAGEAPNSSNLTLKTYNQGSVVVDSAVTTGTGVDFTNNTVTTGTGLYIAANAITTGNAANIVSTSTAGGASGASYLLNLARSGANANLAHTAYGIYSAVTNTNATSGTNIAGYFSASGATTANWGVYSAAGNNYFNGNVGIGTTSPGAKLEVGDGTDSLQVSSVGDLTFVDADGAASITGPAGGALTINGGSGQALNLDSGTTGAVNIGTGANAKTITIGNNTGATALALTSGTGSQTFTSSVVSGTTTTSAWVFNDAALTTGTGAYFTSSTLTTGKLVDISNTSNTQTTGTMFNISSTATSLTTGSLATLDWSPGSVQTTAATGNLFNINIGANASNFAGNLFNVGDAGSSIFSISKSAVTTSLPMSLTAPGDLSVAYDINMTNPTSSFIKSSSALTLQAGEVYNSADLTLKTYNQGSVVFDSAVTTGTAIDIQNTTLTTGYGLSFTGPSSTGITGSALYAASDIGSAGKLLNLAPDFSGSAVTGYGIYNAGTDATANANTNYGYYGSLVMTGNAAKNGYGLYQTVTSSSTTADTTYGGNFATSVTGAVASGTQNTYGLYSTATAANTAGGTVNTYGGYFKADGTVASGTINSHGLYVDNGTMNTTGTSTKYGLYIATQSGADTNYPIYVAGGTSYLGTGISGVSGDFTISAVGGSVSIGGSGLKTSGIFPSAPNSLAIRGGSDNNGRGKLQSFAYTARTSETIPWSVEAQTYTITGSYATQRFWNFEQSTITAASALNISSEATTLSISGAPISAGSATIANAYGLKIDSGTSVASGVTNAYGLYVAAPTGATNNYAATFATGNVGIGTTAPSAPLEVKGTGTGATIAKFTDVNTTGCTIADGGTISCSSDRRLKKNIESLPYGLDTLMALNAVEFNWNYQGDGTTKSLGFIAQEVETVVPNLVMTDSSTGYKQLNTIGLVPVLAKSLQQLNSKVDKNKEVLDSASLHSNNNYSSSEVEKYNNLESRVKGLEASLSAVLDEVVLHDGRTINDSSSSAALAESRSTIDSSWSDLIALAATSSADLSTPSSIFPLPEGEGQGEGVYSLTISETLKSLGKTFLGDTTIAGNFSVDGTMSISGSSINSIASDCSIVQLLDGSSNSAIQQCNNETLGVLYIQDSPLATLVDFFNGQVKITKEGTISAQKIETSKIVITSPVIASDSAAISNNSIGTSSLKSGTKEIYIETTAVTANSKILVTPLSETDSPLFVSLKESGKGFKMKIKYTQTEDISFDWLIVDSK